MLQLKDKQVLVLGLGDTGLSALRWLARQGARLSVADSRALPPGLDAVRQEFPGMAIHLGPFTAAAFKEAELIVASPGVPVAEPQVQAAIERGVPVVGDVELFAQARSAHAKVIAITGANGKSTVTTLVGEICKAAGFKTVVAGNIGLPVLDVINDAVDVYVLELSSFQLETTYSLAADAATVLNISADHMDRYADMQAYANAKARIFTRAGLQVLNADDAWSRGMAAEGVAQLTFGLDAPRSAQDFGLLHDAGEAWLARGQRKLMPVADLNITGLHNAANALAALALCTVLDIDEVVALQALRDFKGLPHRVQWVADIDGVSFYDDSKGTNVGATVAALHGLNRKLVLIAGGDGKGQDFAALRAPVAKHARAVVLIGRDAGVIADALQESGVLLEYGDTLEEAVVKAFNLADRGDAVLLSPACASLDMFRNYVHRAEVFVKAVTDLQKKEVSA
ncbi:UDP-N-acetylmuramoyl-L-alanine--D-glutamate ligase [Methylobacillus flagellatus]|uniref:UDP-N-acetylmuramoylalanine--D-glutamate ligase n=1 Tax=Methylobacillus flagellatus (strain ATCC 51484 / DSM 6875 / VKM B-1610 / KT) TaxID=265072 RepID=MURD_METFK|nr:UDP-N-acetylmuramoyl-L-alanine--D-glutamate ligase [Methylobacillus flagellatus]Q1GYZ9.1 RecName: Full=UDP-N-acetylmuramoylalanine--D-glutamate ligase; AltName: Full=D-glutamic acid-adding enzyme; AltName: Full=UDP-N-acetylmuramoyl-L-alanyl-D-glutamate synthetase [Methylobacillus flagellatus KT]ABE50538.1 UDP-N-acetylmuramoylalanine--D-glutamate ligase [Methylobacillus flagellatus KT]